jgi:hypothetical protein
MNKAVSSYSGRINKLLFAIAGADERPIEEAATAYAEIIKSFPPEIEFYIVGSFTKSHEGIEDKQKLEQDFGSDLYDAIIRKVEGSKITVIPINFSFEHDWMIKKLKILSQKVDLENEQPAYDFNDWIQDPFVVLNNSCNQIVLLESIYPKSNVLDQIFLCDLIVAKTEFSMKTFPYILTGGNVLIGDDFMFVGVDELRLNAKEFNWNLTLRKNKVGFESELKKSCGVSEVLWVNLPVNWEDNLPDLSTALQPMFHIDLYLTMCGRNPLNGRFRVMVGKAYEAHEKSGSDVYKLKSELLDKTADQLQTLGLEVERIPLVFTHDNQNCIEKVYSYNNALVEVYHGFRKVYLPLFKDIFTKFNFEAAKKFIDWGFAVIPVNGLDKYAISHSGLHCITKDLSRSQM